ncbi:MAG: hypothetical protein FD153_1390, partial [Rhodospirillaceae bacterium]
MGGGVLNLSSVENLDASAATSAVTVTLASFGQWDYGSVAAVNTMFVTTGSGGDTVYAGKSGGASHDISLGAGADTVIATELNEGWWGWAAVGHTIDLGAGAVADDSMDGAVDKVEYNNFFALQSRGTSYGPLINQNYDLISSFGADDQIVFGGNFTVEAGGWPVFNLDKDAGADIDFQNGGVVAEVVGLAENEAGIINIGGSLTEENVKAAIESQVVFASTQQTRGLLVFNGTDATGDKAMSSVYLLRDDNWNMRVDAGELIHVADVQGTLTANNFAIKSAGIEEAQAEGTSNVVEFGEAEAVLSLPLGWWDRINVTGAAITDFVTVGVTQDATETSRGSELQAVIGDYLTYLSPKIMAQDAQGALLFRWTDTDGAMDYTLFVDNGDGVYQEPGVGGGGDVLVNFTADSFIDSPWTVVDRANLTNLETDGRMVAGQYNDGTTIDVGSATLISTGGFTTAWDGTPWTLTMAEGQTWSTGTWTADLTAPDTGMAHGNTIRFDAPNGMEASVKEVVGFYWNPNDNSDDGTTALTDDSATTTIDER